MNNPAKRRKSVSIPTRAIKLRFILLLLVAISLGVVLPVAISFARSSSVLNDSRWKCRVELIDPIKSANANGVSNASCILPRTRPVPFTRPPTAQSIPRR